jgi:hypothetical protein
MPEFPLKYTIQGLIKRLYNFNTTPLEKFLNVILIIPSTLLSIQLLHTADHILSYPASIPQDPFPHALLLFVHHPSYILLSYSEHQYA